MNSARIVLIINALSNGFQDLSFMVLLDHNFSHLESQNQSQKRENEREKKERARQSQARRSQGLEVKLIFGWFLEEIEVIS